MDLSALLEGFSGRLDLGGSVADEDGIYRLVFDGSLEVEVVPMGVAMARVQGAVGDDPADRPGSERALEELLRLNLARLRRRGELLSLDPEAGRLWLSRTLTLRDLDVDRFCVIMEEFLDSLSLCRAAFAEASGLSDAPSFGPVLRLFG